MSTKLSLLGIAFVFTLKVFAQSPFQVLYGLDFSPYLNGQDPNLNSQISAAQISSRMQGIASYTTWIRSFSSTSGLENIPAAARQFGLKVAANAWISSNLTQNNAEIANLIIAANAGQVSIAIVGSEALLRNDVTEGQLLAYMAQVRQAIPANIPVTTADTWGTLLAHPNVVAASDIVFGNFYPYWEGISINNAVCALATEYHQLVVAAGNKPVIISETGWPSGGNAVGAAVPSPANAVQYFLQFVSWAMANSIPYFYFEAFDENWKAAYEGPQGAYWGIWDANGVLKPGMQAAFNGQTSPVTCNGTIGGPGAPAINFTYVPPYGSGDSLEGQVLHVGPSNSDIAVYINVSGGWWTKPTFAQPVTSIQADGTWSTPIDTGGSDQFATMIAAFLIPSSFSAPLLSGSSTLPSSLMMNSAAQVQVQRSQNSISGRVTDNLGHPLSGVLISGGSLGSAMSAPDGKYSFFNIPASGSVTLTPSYPNFIFTPPSRNLIITSGNQTSNFSAASTVDLSISSTLSSSLVSLGSRVTDSLVVANAGIASASDAVATISVPGSFSIVSATTTRGSCSIIGTQITCDVGGLVQTAYASITLIFIPRATGSFNISGSVSGPNADLNSGNNSISEALRVTSAVSTKVGAYNTGYWVLDQNGNFAWDGTSIDKLIFWSLGQAGEIPVYGDWNGDGRTKIGLYVNGTWLLDYNGNGVWDGPGIDRLVYFGGPGYTPVLGDWNGSGTTKIGVHQNGTWLIDYNGNFAWDGPGTDKLIFFGGPGYAPVLGDWNGSGTTKIGVHQNGTWLIDYNGNFAWDGPGTDKLIFFGGPGYTPVMGDWNGSGTTKIGAYQNGLWLLDYNGNFAWDGTGTDKLIFFGGIGYTPIVGDWNGSGTTKIAAYLNGQWVIDVDGNFIWNPPTDKVIFWGGAGQTPVVGKW